MRPIKLQVKPLVHVLNLVTALLTLGLLIPFLIAGWLQSAKILDKEGVTRGDGKKFLWVDLRKVGFEHRRRRYNPTERLATVRLTFTDGQTYFSPRTLVNEKEVMEFTAFLADKSRDEA